MQLLAILMLALALALVPTSKGAASVATSKEEVSVSASVPKLETSSCLAGCLEASNISSVDPPTECPQYERTLDCTMICLFKH